MSPPPPSKKSKSELARFYEATVEGRSLRSSDLKPVDDDDSDGGGESATGNNASGAGDADSDLEGRDYSWKKTIMIGPSYQVGQNITQQRPYTILKIFFFTITVLSGIG